MDALLIDQKCLKQAGKWTDDCKAARETMRDVVLRGEAGRVDEGDETG